MTKEERYNFLVEEYIVGPFGRSPKAKPAIINYKQKRLWIWTEFPDMVAQRVEDLRLPELDKYLDEEKHPKFAMRCAEKAFVDRKFDPHIREVEKEFGLNLPSYTRSRIKKRLRNEDFLYALLKISDKLEQLRLDETKRKSETEENS